ncbi:MAG: TGS domain-containing protein [Nanoarchaeota archaeon]|nr:TGS domain-containing protein [Nanoarchaeota archaeon]
MPVNPGFEYQRAEQEYLRAVTIDEKLSCLKKMLQLVPKHKGSENLVAEIKKRISKINKLKEKQKLIAKRTGRTSFNIKKEGAARVCIIGSPNSGKSTLLSNITNAKPEIADYPFTTAKPEIGTMDYHGVKIQVIEIPAIAKDFIETEKSGIYIAIIKDSNLLVICSKNNEEKKIVLEELKKSRVNLAYVEYNYQNKENKEEIKQRIWKNLGIIKVYTKQPHKEKEFPPVALKKNSTVENLARKVHKDFLKNFKYAKVYGKSVKFQGQQVGIRHILQDDDVVELHMKD